MAWIFLSNPSRFYDNMHIFAEKCGYSSVVEHRLPKPRAAGSTPVTRSTHLLLDKQQSHQRQGYYRHRGTDWQIYSKADIFHNQISNCQKSDSHS